MIFPTHTYKYKNKQNNNQQKTTTNLSTQQTTTKTQKQTNERQSHQTQPTKGLRKHILSAKQKPAFLQPILKTMVQNKERKKMMIPSPLNNKNRLPFPTKNIQETQQEREKTQPQQQKVKYLYQTHH